MLLCPECGAKTHVPRSNVSDDNCIVRQRICKQCGHREVSVEVYLSSMRKGFNFLANKEEQALSNANSSI